MTTLGSLEITSKILCDSVRKEISNKIILIGVYPGDIIVTEFPAQLDLAFYVEGFSRETSLRELHFRIVGPEGELAKFGVRIQAREGVNFSVQSPSMTFFYAKSGILQIQVSDNGEDWNNLIEKNIEKGDVPGAISIDPLPPSEQSPSDAPEKD